MFSTVFFFKGPWFVPGWYSLPWMIQLAHVFDGVACALKWRVINYYLRRLVFGNVLSELLNGGLNFTSALNSVRESANQTSCDWNLSANSFPAFRKRIGVSKVDTLCPMRTEWIGLFVMVLALSKACDTQLWKCAIASWKGSVCNTSSSIKFINPWSMEFNVLHWQNVLWEGVETRFVSYWKLADFSRFTCWICFSVKHQDVIVSILVKINAFCLRSRGILRNKVLNFFKLVDWHC